ncbi:hypothetical protein GCM10025867_38780 [Frondihabitans sucicola]|uniref:DUF4244 domain-containing protein n=1 Tax=Frondihabitans sucicola TaxID=1268041 RepID=A0ABM8GT39_9MICO|nr:hypothetical protein GCM10025867_38780 [Frondihabitans sucicola]
MFPPLLFSRFHRVPRLRRRFSDSSVRSRRRLGDTPLGGRLLSDEGAATAEYAIVIMAGVSFAGVLVTILRSGQIQSVLTDLVNRALTVG